MDATIGQAVSSFDQVLAFKQRAHAQGGDAVTATQSPGQRGRPPCLMMIKNKDWSSFCTSCSEQC